MFSDKVGGTGMQRSCKEARHEQVPYGVHTHGAEEDVIEGELSSEVHRVPPCKRLGFDEAWSKGVE